MAKKLFLQTILIFTLFGGGHITSAKNCGDAYFLCAYKGSYQGQPLNPPFSVEGYYGRECEIPVGPYNTSNPRQMPCTWHKWTIDCKPTYTEQELLATWCSGAQIVICNMDGPNTILPVNAIVVPAGDRNNGCGNGANKKSPPGWYGWTYWKNENQSKK